MKWLLQKERKIQVIESSMLSSPVELLIIFMRYWGTSIFIGLTFSGLLYSLLRYKWINFSNILNRLNTTLDRLTYIAVFWFMVILIPWSIAFIIMNVGFHTHSSELHNSALVLLNFILFAVSIGFALVTYQIITISSFKNLKKHKVLDMSDWDYIKGGKLYKWPDATYRYLKKIKWYDQFYLDTRKVASHIYKLPNVVFVSPSANKGRIEEKLYDIFPKKIDFLLMDYVRNIEGKVTTKSNGKFTYVDGSFNGNNLKENLSKVDIKFADIIMDIRGCLWYSTNKDDKNGEGITRVFKEYYKSIKMGGIIIIDAAELSDYEVMFNSFIYKATNYVCGFQEVSTYQKIERFIFKDEFVSKHFEFEAIGKGSNSLYTFKKIA